MRKSVNFKTVVIIKMIITEKRDKMKNSRSFMFAPDFINDLQKMKQLRRIIVIGCCTDLCVLDGVLSLINYLDESNKNVEVIVKTGMVEIYDSPTHNRKEFNNMAFRLIRQEGVKIIGGEKYE